MALCSGDLGVSTLFLVSEGYRWLYAGPFFIPREESCFGDIVLAFNILLPFFVVTVVLLPGTLGVNRFSFAQETSWSIYSTWKILFDNCLVGHYVIRKFVQNFLKRVALVPFVQKEQTIVASTHATFPMNLVVFSEKLFPLQGSRCLPVLKAVANRKSRSTRIHLLPACSKPNGFLYLQADRHGWTKRVPVWVKSKRNLPYWMNSRMFS